MVWKSPGNSWMTATTTYIFQGLLTTWVITLMGLTSSIIQIILTLSVRIIVGLGIIILEIIAVESIRVKIIGRFIIWRNNTNNSSSSCSNWDLRKWDKLILSSVILSQNNIAFLKKHKNYFSTAERGLIR